MKWQRCTLRLFLLMWFAGLRSLVLASDIAIDTVAQNLELVRNQISLALSNHATLRADLQRQAIEAQAWRMFERIPLVNNGKNATESEAAILEDMRSELSQRIDSISARAIRLRFAGPWRCAAHRIPQVVIFGTGYAMPEDQIADSRQVRIEFESKAGLSPKTAHDWLTSRKGHLRRLLVPEPLQFWRRSGRYILGIARIYRFRAITYPRILAPDLSLFRVDETLAQSASEKRSLARIARYHQDVIESWPRLAPDIDHIRAFVVNDLRIELFLRLSGLRPNSKSF